MQLRIDLETSIEKAEYYNNHVEALRLRKIYEKIDIELKHCELSVLDLITKIKKEYNSLANDASILDKYRNEIADSFKKIHQELEQINPKLTSDDILDYINNFNNYLSSLSVTELCLLMNILISILIFTCLISIISAFYGNFLIEKFNLEKKYPKISTFLKIRNKLQHTYIFINTIVIVLSLLLLLFINITTFFI
jgi:hypothetical protein